MRKLASDASDLLVYTKTSHIRFTSEKAHLLNYIVKRSHRFTVYLYRTFENIKQQINSKYIMYELQSTLIMNKGLEEALSSPKFPT